MARSIQEVARVSRVTARTLRYYDEIGLLPPAQIGANGYRYYEQEQLLRLQHILLLRELGLDLASIASVVDGGDTLTALREHREQLLRQRDQLDTLLRTVSVTIAHLEEGTHMPAEEMFEGFRFDRDKIDELAALAAERGDADSEPYFDELRRRTADWGADEFRDVDRQAAEIEIRLLNLMQNGVAADDARVLDVLDDDVAAQRQLMPLSAEDYGKLGQAFAAAPELRAHLDARDPHLADFLRDAMLAYAATRM
jgi:DNA-binding transcriptional MerR regulator